MSLFKDLRKYFNQRRLIQRAPRQWIIDQSDIPGCSNDELRLIQAGYARNAQEARRMLQGRAASLVLAEMPKPKLNRLKRLEWLLARWQGARPGEMKYRPELRVPIRARYKLPDDVG